MKNKTITRSKGGTKERKVRLSRVVIPDLWHIAQADPDLTCREAILECWNLTHDLLRELMEGGAK